MQGVFCKHSAIYRVPMKEGVIKNFMADTLSYFL